jgi:hypothetical protein
MPSRYRETHGMQATKHMCVCHPSIVAGEMELAGSLVASSSGDYWWLGGTLVFMCMAQMALDDHGGQKGWMLLEGADGEAGERWQ